MTGAPNRIEREADSIMRSSGIEGAANKSREALSEEDRETLDAVAHSMIQSLAKILIGSSSMLRTVSQGELVVLLAISFSEEPPTPMHLSEEVALTRPRITQILDSLEKKGLVERGHDEHDRRRVRVNLTEKGTAATEDLILKMEALLKNYLILIGKEDGVTFDRILAKTADMVYGFPGQATNDFLIG